MPSERTLCYNDQLMVDLLIKIVISHSKLSAEQRLSVIVSINGGDPNWMVDS